MERINTPLQQEEETAVIPLFVHEIAVHRFERITKRLVLGLCAALAATGLVTIASFLR